MNYDQLTKLLNNKALIDRLHKNDTVTYFLINIDNFSTINDAFGYDVGDKVLIEISQYLKKFTPVTGTMFRYCSDRFVLVDSQKLNDEQMATIAKSILSFFSLAPMVIEDEIELQISLTIGISKAKGVINITQAELAMKELRETRRNDFKIFNPSSKFVNEKQQNVVWMHKIQEAIIDENIIAYFQPIINNRTGKLEKYECLARLRDEEEIISPYRFMRAAKETGNIAFVTKALIAQSFKKFSKTEFEFSINITDSDLSMDYLEGFLLKNVDKYNINPSRVILEILEDITTLDKGTTLKQLNSLRENGFKVAIDDFGSENSNFSRLLDIEPNYIKIDGSFIKNILTDKKSQIIVDAIIMICKKSGIEMIAEFVHSQEVQNRVKELGIDYSQGYYFGEPSPDLKVIQTFKS